MSFAKVDGLRRHHNAHRAGRANHLAAFNARITAVMVFACRVAPEPNPVPFMFSSIVGARPRIRRVRFASFARGGVGADALNDRWNEQWRRSCCLASLGLFARYTTPRKKLLRCQAVPPRHFANTLASSAKLSATIAAF